jgi:hypothetical protein
MTPFPLFLAKSRPSNSFDLGRSVTLDNFNSQFGDNDIAAS